MAKNIEMKRDGDKLIITVDLSKDFGESKSGKSKIIASTEGNIKIEGSNDLYAGINIYKKI